MRHPLVLLLLASIVLPAAADDRLFIRPWIELEPLVRIEAEARHRLLEEARELFSGMVYGWTFVYTPGDRERRVAEIFDLSPVAEIPWGSPRLSVRESEVEGTRLYARICYTMSADELARRTAWSSSSAALSTGRGSAPAIGGPAQKAASLEAAIREAVRVHLNTRVLNKPREIRGEIVLWDDPYTTVRSGAYSTTARVKLRVSEITPYRIF
jgi:hypothetical protein